MSDRSTSAILRLAAARVRQGWIQGKGIFDGRVCAFGAIAKTVAPAVYGVLPVNSYCFDEDEDDAISAATLALRRALGMRDLSELYDWNDKYDQTAEGVASGLERAADWWDDQQIPKVAWTHREKRVEGRQDTPAPSIAR